MTTLPYIGITHIPRYQACNRKWLWSKRDRWEWNGPRRLGVHDMGIEMHYILNLLLQEHVAGRAWEEFDIHTACAEWEENAYEDEEMRLQAAREHAPYARSMAQFVMRWFMATGFLDEWEIVGMEMPLSMDFAGLEVRGILDFVIQHKVTGMYGILDFKSGANLNRGLHALDWQMWGYALLLDANDMEPYYGFHLKVKRVKSGGSASPPFVNKEEIRFGKKELASFEKMFAAQLVRMQVDDVGLPSTSRDCFRCGFLDACETVKWDGDPASVLRETHIQVPVTTDDEGDDEDGS